MLFSSCTTQFSRTDPNTNLSAPPTSDPNVSPIFEHCPKFPCSCACDDPFDPRVIPKLGDFSNLCLNTCEQRSVKGLSIEELRKYNYFDLIDSVKNYYAVNVTDYEENGRIIFYAAMIPKEGIKDVIMQIEHAGGIQAHAELRISFTVERPVLLISQRVSTPKLVKKCTDLVFSVEALAPPGVPYKGDYGFRAQYFQSYRLTTLFLRAHKMIKQDHHKVWQYRCKLSQDEKVKLMEQIILTGTINGHSNHYHTIKNNCIIELFKIIDKSVSLSWLTKCKIWISPNSTFLPTKAPENLKKRGLNPKKESDFHLQNLETELGWEEYIDEKIYQ